MDGAWSRQAEIAKIFHHVFSNSHYGVVGGLGRVPRIAPRHPSHTTGLVICHGLLVTLLFVNWWGADRREGIQSTASHVRCGYEITENHAFTANPAIAPRL